MFRNAKRALCTWRSLFAPLIPCSPIYRVKFCPAIDISLVAAAYAAPRLLNWLVMYRPINGPINNHTHPNFLFKSPMAIFYYLHLLIEIELDIFIFNLYRLFEFYINKMLYKITPRNIATVHEEKATTINTLVFLISPNTKNNPMNSANNPIITWEKIRRLLRVVEISDRRLETREKLIQIKDKPLKKIEVLAVLSCFRKFFVLAYFHPKIWDYNDTNKTSRRKINQPHLNRTKTQKDHGAGFAIPERAGQH